MRQVKSTQVHSHPELFPSEHHVSHMRKVRWPGGPVGWADGGLGLSLLPKEQGSFN